MITLTPISISATAQQYDVRVVQKLCKAVCINDNVQPQYRVEYVASEPVLVNGTAYVTITAKGSVSYQPAGCSNCFGRTDLFSESFEVAFIGDTVPTIALTQGSQKGSLVQLQCCKSDKYAISTNLTITATF